MVCVSLYFLDEKGVVHAEINWFVLGQIIIAGWVSEGRRTSPQPTVRFQLSSTNQSRLCVIKGGLRIFGEEIKTHIYLQYQ